MINYWNNLQHQKFKIKFQGSEEIESMSIFSILKRASATVVVAKVPKDIHDVDLNVVMARGMKMTCEVHLEELKDLDFDMVS